MKNLYLLLRPELLEELDKYRKAAPVLLAAYQALWHPLLLADADHLPERRDISDLPSESDCVLAVPKFVLDQADKAIRDDLHGLDATVLVADETHTGVQGPGRLAAALDFPAGDPELLLDFQALGYAYLGLQILYDRMGHDDPIDDWTLMTEVRQAAESFAEGNPEATRDGLQSAFDQLLSARQTAYPATVNLVDLALFPPNLTIKELQQRVRWQAPVNLIISGGEIEQLAERDESLVEALRNAVAMGNVEILGGTYDDRPFTLLPPESRHWQLERSTTAYEKHLGREVDCFGSRTAALSCDLPQVLMKQQYRYALHAAFDGSKLPYFREPKLHWTAPDGSVIEALARVAHDASIVEDVFRILGALGKSLVSDRAATLTLVHWLNRTAPWYEWLVRINEYAEVFGKLEKFSDFFLNSSAPDKPTATRAEEYHSRSLQSSVARGEAAPLGRWVDHHRRRGQLDAVRALAAMHQMATGESPANLAELENAVETDAPDAHSQLAAVEDEAFAKLSALTLADAEKNPGYLIYNPCSFPRRVCLELDDLPEQLPIERPLRAMAVGAEKSAVVVDVPGWGYSWIPRRRGDQPGPAEPPSPLVRKRRLRNDHLEVEIDRKTGGIRGIWEVRDGYSRIGQQLVHGAGSRMVCRQLEVTCTGPAFGEITTRGEILSRDGRRKLATFRQRVRLWMGRPVVELAIRVKPVEALAGDPEENYLACRWAWPDEKTMVLPASGFLLRAHRGSNLESGQLIELRERKLYTDILPYGLPYHHRVGYRMLDSLLMVPGEAPRELTLAVAFDLANPWTAVQDASWPVVARKVEQGPPKSGPTGWFAKLDQADVICSRMISIEDYCPGVQLRLVETAGKTAHCEMQFSRSPDTGRLTNGRGQLIFDIHVDDDSIPVDFSPNEMQQVEVLF